MASAGSNKSLPAVSLYDVTLRSQVFAFAMSVCAVAAGSVAAQQTPLGQGLDLLVIADRSESMPDRDVATLMLHMTLDIVARNGRAMRLRHRIGVIGFGSTVSVDMPLTVVDPEDLPRMHRRIASLPSSTLGDTDVLAAFTAATAMFQALPAGSARRRAIVLLTDGVPYVRLTNMDAYRRELQRFAAAHSRGGDPTVDILLLASPSGQRYVSFWRALLFGRVHAVDRDRASLLAEAHRITTRLVGTSSAESLPGKTDDRVEQLIVPPYLDVMVLDIFHSSPGAKVEVFPPGALHPLSGSDEVESLKLGDLMSALVVHRPIPGSWMVRKSSAAARVRILSQQFFPRGLLVRPAVVDGVRQYDRVRVAYSVVDANGRGIEELPAYKLALDLALTKPDGSVEPVPMERRPEIYAAAVFSAVRESDCTLAGRYWTAVGVTSIDASGNRIDVFRDRWSGFSVMPARRVDCGVTAEEQQWIPGVVTRVQCVDSDKRPVEMSALVSGSPGRLFRPLLLHENAQADAALDLQYLGGGSFRGLLRGAERTGAYRLQLAVDRSRVLPSYNLRFAPEAVAFVRRSTVIRRWLLLLSLVVVLGVMSVVVERWRRQTKPPRPCPSP